MVKLNNSEKLVLGCIVRWQSYFMNSPQPVEISRELDMDDATVHSNLIKLEDSGFIDFIQPQTRRLIRLLWKE